MATKQNGPGRAQMTGAEALIKAVEAEGVRHVFGNPGTIEIDILDAIGQTPSLTYVLGLHEEAAMAMADGYARATGRPSFANLHAMVGTANGMGALLTAAKDRTPIVVSAGCHDTRHLFRDAQGEALDLIGTVRQFTKHSLVVPNPSRIAEETTRAFKIAGALPTGPTYMAIPKDFLRAPVEVEVPDPSGFRVARRIPADPDEIDRAADLLLRAERPILVAGGQVVAHGAADLLAELAELLALPVFAEPFGTYLSIASTHPCYLGLYAPGHPMVAEASLVVGVGSRMFIEPDYPRVPMVPRGADVVHIHEDPWEVARVYPTAVPIIADSLSALRALLEAVRARMSTGHARRIAARREVVARAAEALRQARDAELDQDRDAVPIKPWRVVAELSQVCDENALIVNQAVTMGNYILRGYEFRRPGTFAMNSSTYMGWGIGAAIGWKLGDPSRTVVSCVGDGVVVYGAQGLWSAARYRIPVVFVVFNNGTYMAIKSALHDHTRYAAKTGTYVGTEIGDPAVDLAGLARSMGVEAVEVARPAEIRPALERALGAGRPVMLNVIIDPSEMGAHRPKARTAAGRN
ncbi:MAG TPA: thiamine pyrophosphate-binding protein [bacterium]|nr:thiamine pyrophosphate-binding protein [bacterium]